MWEELVEQARWSPSPHNIQPWKVRVLSDTTAEVLYDQKRLIPTLDPTGAFTIAGFGIFIESLDIAARAKGKTIVTKYHVKSLQSGSGLMLFATLQLKGSAKAQFDPGLLLERRTSRLHYDDAPVSDVLLRDLAAIARRSRHKFTFSQDPEMVQWTIQLNCDTMFYDLDDDASRKELNLWIRHTIRDAKKKRDGLAAYCLGFSSLVTYPFFNFHRLFKLQFIRSAFAKRYMQSMHGTRTVGWLQGPFEKFDDWIEAGRMLMRLWLTMTKKGVYLHPFGSIITNKKAHARLREKLQISEGKNMVWLIMRMGHSQEPPRSVRLSAADILVKA